MSTYLRVIPNLPSAKLDFGPARAAVVIARFLIFVVSASEVSHAAVETIPHITKIVVAASFAFAGTFGRTAETDHLVLAFISLAVFVAEDEVP